MNVHDAHVLSCDPRDSHALLRVGRSRLAARRWPGMARGAKVRIRIRPEDVVLCADPPGRVSARNVLPGHVRSVKASPEGATVTVDVGFALAAAVTKGAVAELRLKRGTPVFAMVKATAVAPVTDVRPRLQLSVLGPGGVIGIRQIEFLRQIEAHRSMLSAARAYGITYRTAWMWGREVNRAWGRPLVARSHGGRGGGGTVLTPEATALLRRVAGAEQRINGGGA